MDVEQVGYAEWLESIERQLWDREHPVSTELKGN